MVPARSWAEQIAAVAAGDSFSIRVSDTALSSEQARSLGDVASQLHVLEIAADDDVLRSVPWRSLTRLKQLVVHGPVSDNILDQFSELSQLEILNLPQATFTDAGVESLADHLQLQLLRFHSPNVSDACLGTIAKMRSLRFLHILDCPVSDQGLPALHEMQRLESFYLDGSKCTEDGLSKLLKELPDLHFHWNETHLESDDHKHPH